MRNDKTPAAAEAWLRRARIASASLSRPQRRELLDGLRAHIADALDGGEDLELTLFRLGSPEGVAQEAEESLGGSNAHHRPNWVWDTPRALAVSAMALAVLMLALVALWPTGDVTSTSEGSAIFTTRVGPMSFVFWSGQFLLPMLLCIVGSAITVVVRRARLKWTYLGTAVVVIAAVAAITFGNILLLPSAAAAVGAALSLRARAVRRAHSPRSVA